jgi:hypothetical protein
MWQKIAKEIFANTGAARKTNNNWLCVKYEQRKNAHYYDKFPT